MGRASSRIRPRALVFWRARRAAGRTALVIRIDASANRVPRDRSPLPKNSGKAAANGGACNASRRRNGPPLEAVQEME